MAVAMHATETTIDPGSPRELFQAAFQGFQSPFDVMADGRFLVILDVEQRAPLPITLIINWPAALRKQ